MPRGQKPTRRFIVLDTFWQGHVQVPHNLVGMWLRAATWSARYELWGEIPKWLPNNMPMAPRHCRGLVEWGLWTVDGDGWRMVPDETWRFVLPPVRTRKQIPLRVRQEVYNRDGWRCVRCTSPVNLSLDHIVPHSLGGADTPDNLQTLCQPCNSSKGNRVEESA